MQKITVKTDNKDKELIKYLTTQYSKNVFNTIGFNNEDLTLVNIEIESKCNNVTTHIMYLPNQVMHVGLPCISYILNPILNITGEESVENALDKLFNITFEGNYDNRIIEFNNQLVEQNEGIMNFIRTKEQVAENQIGAVAIVKSENKDSVELEIILGEGRKYRAERKQVYSITKPYMYANEVPYSIKLKMSDKESYFLKTHLATLTNHIYS